jgi:hypothetical protein
MVEIRCNEERDVRAVCTVWVESKERGMYGQEAFEDQTLCLIGVKGLILSLREFNSA